MSNEKKAAAEKKAVPSNPNAVEFDRDEYGITQTLKREGLRAAGRVAGDEGKLRTLVGVLDVLRAHAIARFKAQQQIRIEDNEAAKQRAKAEAERNEKDRQRKIKLHTEELERLEAAAPKG